MKPQMWLRLFIEALLIFFSVVAAFLVENYRVEREIDEQYLSTLAVFRANLYEDIRYFVSKTDTVINYGVIQGDLIHNYKRSLHCINLLNNNDREALREALSILNDIRGFRKKESFLESRAANQLYQYNSQLIKDSVLLFIDKYHRIKRIDQKYTEALNANCDNLSNLLVEIDFSNPGNIDNINILENNNAIRNGLRKYNELVAIEVGENEFLITGLTQIIRKVDKVLHQSGMDTTSLDQHFSNYASGNTPNRL